MYRMFREICIVIFYKLLFKYVVLTNFTIIRM